MTDDVVKGAEVRMRKGIDAFKHEMSRVRTGRAHPSLLEQIRVDYYGSEVPVSQVANISATDARTLAITPWEKKMIPVIEKAVMTSGLGLNPATTGDVIRVPLPPLTEDRRRDLTKLVRGEAENARVSIRTARRDANAALKESVKKKIMTEDDERRLNEIIQKLTDRYVAEVDQLLAAKETDLMAV